MLSIVLLIIWLSQNDTSDRPRGGCSTILISALVLAGCLLLGTALWHFGPAVLIWGAALVLFGLVVFAFLPFLPSFLDQLERRLRDYAASME